MFYYYGFDGCNINFYSYFTRITGIGTQTLTSGLPPEKFSDRVAFSFHEQTGLTEIRGRELKYINISESDCPSAVTVDKRSCIILRDV
jgi:hypothetical protein